MSIFILQVLDFFFSFLKLRGVLQSGCFSFVLIDEDYPSCRGKNALVMGKTEASRIVGHSLDER